MTFMVFAKGATVNLLMLLGFVALLSMARRWPTLKLGHIPPWANGFLFGLMALMAMLAPSLTGPGVMFDCRSGVIGAGALLGGPICALTSILIPSLYRLQIGGLGLLPGLLEIILPAVFGSLCHGWCKRRRPVFTLRFAVLSSLAVGFCTNGFIVGFLLLFMPHEGLLLETGSTLLVILSGPVSMTLFSALLVFEKQHSESVEMRSSILRATMEGYWLSDMQGCLLEGNDAYCRMSGYSQVELLTKRIGDLEVPQSRQEMNATTPEVAAKGSKRFEAQHRRKDGSTFYVDVSEQYFTGEQGRMVSFIRDITDRKKAEQALLESERKYKMLIETTLTGFVIIDINGRVLDANGEYVRLTGRESLDQIRGRPVTDWTAPYDLARNAAEVRKCAETGRVRSLEIDYLDAKGNAVPIEIHATLLSEGETPVIMTVCRDISERRLAAKEREQLHLQLIQAQKMESVGRLAGGIAHDFNNMLAVIMGDVDMTLRALPADSGFRSNLVNIGEAARRSADLTRQLLAFARRQTVEPKVLDLNETVKSMLDMLRRLIGEDIKLAWQPGKNLLPVRIDPSQIHQILANLSVNARDAIGPKAGSITVQTGMTVLDQDYCTRHAECAPGQFVMLAFSDNGHGISQEVLPHIFEPFFTTKEVGHGTGLGLATIYGIVKQNKGFIDISSEPGKGTTFRIYLPSCISEAATSPKRNETPEAPPPARVTVLLVEDEPALLKLTKKMLEMQGHSVLAATTPKDALGIAQDHSGGIDLLITDVVLPGMNGRELARKLGGLHPGIKCLFVSGYTSDIIANSGVLDEGIHFLQKPFVSQDLLEKVRMTLAL